MATRLPAEERKAAVLECACGIFSTGSYRGTTTAEIARQAGVTEPVLYRHFASKRDLYLAVLEESWGRLRAMWKQAVDDEPDARFWVAAMGQRLFRGQGPEGAVRRALDPGADRGERRRGDPEVPPQADARGARLRERRHPALTGAGGILPDRDANAEAWIFIAIGLLGTVGRRVGSASRSRLRSNHRQPQKVDDRDLTHPPTTNAGS